MSENVNATLILATHRSHFEAFKEALRARGPKEARIAARLLFCNSVADFKLNHRYDVICVGPYWTMKDFPEIMNAMLERCQGKFVAIQWFPHPVRATKARIAAGQVIG